MSSPELLRIARAALAIEDDVEDPVQYAFADAAAGILGQLLAADTVEHREALHAELRGLRAAKARLQALANHARLEAAAEAAAQE